jgi:hypothetical protein
MIKPQALAACAALLAGFGHAPSALAARDTTIAVAANADQDYVRQKFGGQGAKAESYVFAQGRYFGGYLRDASLEHMQFQEIARDLAPGLMKHRFYPAADGRNADLLIVVHWGITSIEEDPANGPLDFDKLQRDGMAYNALASKGTIADHGSFLADLGVLLSKSAGNASDEADNAQLLGYTSELRKEEYRSAASPSGMTDMDRRLRHDLADERYFVILMAYDMGTLKGGRNGAKPKLLWSTHASVRAIGFNFKAALPAMSSAAADFFGDQVDDLLLNARKIPEGRVDVGESKRVDDRGVN